MIGTASDSLAFNDTLSLKRSKPRELIPISADTTREELTTRFETRAKGAKPRLAGSNREFSLVGAAESLPIFAAAALSRIPDLAHDAVKYGLKQWQDYGASEERYKSTPAEDISSVQDAARKWAGTAPIALAKWTLESGAALGKAMDGAQPLTDHTHHRAGSDPLRNVKSIASATARGGRYGLDQLKKYGESGMADQWREYNERLLKEGDLKAKRAIEEDIRHDGSLARKNEIESSIKELERLHIHMGLSPEASERSTKYREELAKARVWSKWVLDSKWYDSNPEEFDEWKLFLDNELRQWREHNTALLDLWAASKKHFSRNTPG